MGKGRSLAQKTQITRVVQLSWPLISEAVAQFIHVYPSSWVFQGETAVAVWNVSG